MDKSFDFRRLFKWLFFVILLLVIIAIIYSISLYRDLEKSKARGMPQTEQKVYQETNLVKIEKIESFYGEESYHIVYGTDEDKHKMLAFVPLDTNDKDIIMIDQVDIISKESIHNQWEKSCTQCKMVKIIPGIVDDNIVWELTYRDELNRYVLEFLSISDGEQYERLRFTERFK